jgi:hypothetical protein
MAESVKLMSIEWAKGSNAGQNILLASTCRPPLLRILWVSRHLSPKMRRPELRLVMNLRLFLRSRMSRSLFPMHVGLCLISVVPNAETDLAFPSKKNQA